MSTELRKLLGVPPGPVSLADFDAAATPGFDGDKEDGQQALAEMADPLRELQEKIYAQAYAGADRRVLVVLQGMDTAGKGGIVDHTFGLIQPQGLRLKSFKKPTKEELAHDFLWRIDRALPEAGKIGVFDRSHYEDVLVVRVHGLAEPDEIERRYQAINAWEQNLVDSGYVVIKCMLHISPGEQRERLLARLERPEKQWKFKPGDVDERALWGQYTEAYEIALERCNSQAAAWHVVPSDRKWYRNWAVGQLVLEHLQEMDLDWPQPSYDIGEQRQRLADFKDEVS